MRDQAARALRSVAGRGSSKEQTVVTVKGSAGTPNDLADGLDSLANLVTQLLADPNNAVKKRAALARLTPAYATTLRDAASNVRATAKAATIPSPPQNATQSELDLLDGINLHILADIVRAFESANDIDPTIPRLVPISTRRALGKRSSPKPVEADTPTEPVTP